MSWVHTARYFHEDSYVAEVAQTPAGQVATWALASGLLVWHGVPLLGPLALGFSFVWPHHRRLILSLASIGMIFDRYVMRQGVDLTLSSLTSAFHLPGPWLKVFVLTGATIVALYLMYAAGKNMDRWPSPVKRHPYLVLHLGVLGAFVLVYVFPAFGVLVEVIPWLLWRVCFLIQFSTRGGTATTKFSDHLFYLWPIVGISGSPYGKGLAYLSSREAKDDLALAASRLAGLKLLLLAALWEFVLQLADATIYGSPRNSAFADFGFNLGLPTLTQAMVIGNVGLATAWLTVFLELIRIVLYYAVIGHVIVGFLRLCGFNIFRNTYKPLLSESIVEFWGRFNYYFKELMVEFFFYPTFLNGRRLGPRVRLFVAVFAAAFVGNMYYHVLVSPVMIAVGDFRGIWALWGPRLVYCLLLTIGIWVSMLRQQSARKERTRKSTVARVQSIAGVWLFYAVIHIWSIYGEGLTWANRAEFCLKLVGLTFTGWIDS